MIQEIFIGGFFFCFGIIFFFCEEEENLGILVKNFTLFFPLMFPIQAARIYSFIFFFFSLFVSFIHLMPGLTLYANLQ
jgi:hypothetical protein